MRPLSPRIDVCIATFKRPALLETLLDSLAAQRLADPMMFRVIVVDNDRDESARAVVDAVKTRVPYALQYEREPRQGISFARNRALACSTAEYIAFVDDDERVEDDWLQQLYDTLRQFEADAVFGPVTPILPTGAPAWASSQPAFQRPIRATGTMLKAGATNNVLMSRHALGSPPQTFDPAFALTGGEDTAFFRRLYLNGKRLVWCDTANVYEKVPLERLTTEWIYRRSFRGGQCFARIVMAREDIVSKAGWYLKKVGQVAVAAPLLPWMYMASYPSYVRLRCRVQAALGQITGLWGPAFRYYEYNSESYRSYASRLADDRTDR